MFFSFVLSHTHLSLTGLLFFTIRVPLCSSLSSHLPTILSSFSLITSSLSTPLLPPFLSPFPLSHPSLSYFPSLTFLSLTFLSPFSLSHPPLSYLTPLSPYSVTLSHPFLPPLTLPSNPCYVKYKNLHGRYTLEVFTNPFQTSTPSDKLSPCSFSTQIDQGKCFTQCYTVNQNMFFV